MLGVVGSLLQGGFLMSGFLIFLFWLIILFFIIIIIIINIIIIMNAEKYFKRQSFWEEIVKIYQSFHTDGKPFIAKQLSVIFGHLELFSGLITWNSIQAWNTDMLNSPSISVSFVIIITHGLGDKFYFEA